VQSDTVGELEVVTGRGLTLTCSPTAHQGLFDAVRAGLGQAAIITRVTLRLVPAPRHARRFLLTCPTLSAMLNDQRRLVTEDRFDAVQGAVLAAPSGGWTFHLDAVKQFSGRAPDDGALLAGLGDDRAQAQPATMPYLAYRDRLAALERALRAGGQWSLPHPWLCTFVGGAAVEQVVARELEQLRPADLGEAGQVALSPIRRAPVRSPLIRMPSDELCYAVNLLRFPDATGATQAGWLVAANRAAYDRIRAAGGTLYPVSAFPMTPPDWRQHFGPALGLLADAKRDHDPDHILTPGYEIFDA